MRISDWSSDVCSSDLHPFHRRSHEIDVLGKVSSTAQHMGEQHIECARHDLYQSDAGQRHGLSAGQSHKDTRYADRPTRVDNDSVRVLDSAEQIAQKSGDSFVTVERLLLALTLATTTPAGKALADAGVKAEGLNAAFNPIRQGRSADTATAEEPNDALKKIASDLTQAARDGTQTGTPW